MCKRSWQVETYNLAHEHDVLASHEEDATCDVTVSVANKDALDGVLQYEVGCGTSMSRSVQSQHETVY